MRKSLLRKIIKKRIKKVRIKRPVYSKKLLEENLRQKILIKNALDKMEMDRRRQFEIQQKDYLRTERERYRNELAKLANDLDLHKKNLQDKYNNLLPENDMASVILIKEGKPVVQKVPQKRGLELFEAEGKLRLKEKEERDKLREKEERKENIAKEKEYIEEIYKEEPEEEEEIIDYPLINKETLRSLKRQPFFLRLLKEIDPDAYKLESIIKDSEFMEKLEVYNKKIQPNETGLREFLNYLKSGSGSFSKKRTEEPKGTTYNDQIDKQMQPLRKHGYLGTFMSDEIRNIKENELQNRGSFIMNLDSSKGPGTHWVAIYWDLRHPCLIENQNQGLFYFDPLGDPPSPEFMFDIKGLIQKIKDKFNIECEVLFEYNHDKYQSDKSNYCGWFSMAFLTDMYNGYDFEEQKSYVKKSEKNIRNFSKK